jgi:hypothetical protein
LRASASAYGVSGSQGVTAHDRPMKADDAMHLADKVDGAGWFSPWAILNL